MSRSHCTHLQPLWIRLNVGLRGEYTAAVLNLHKDRRIRYIPPAKLGEYAGGDLSVTATLEKAVTGLGATFRSGPKG